MAQGGQGGLCDQGGAEWKSLGWWLCPGRPADGEFLKGEGGEGRGGGGVRSAAGGLERAERLSTLGGRRRGSEAFRVCVDGCHMPLCGGCMCACVPGVYTFCACGYV